MLYYDFKNYEEFKEIFGIIEHGNGVKSRKNKILLALYKDKRQLKNHIVMNEIHSLRESINRVVLRRERANDNSYDYYTDIKKALVRRKEALIESCHYDLLRYTSLPALKTYLYNILCDWSFRLQGCNRSLYLMGMTFYSNQYETDDMEGLCEDGTLNAIRYHNIEKDRVFKMKAGRMFNHILDCNRVANKLPEQIKRWLSEEFVADWIEFARENIGETEYTLHVDDDFCAIYSRDRCAGYDSDNDSFRSCMQGDGQWTFYRDAVKAKAAYLTDSDDMIVARCIIFTEVFDEDDKKWRLAERQYSKGADLAIQRQLVSALIRGGHIDGYKKVGASCHDGRAFVDNEGNSLESKKFRISCHLDDNDTMSYQDSFKGYSYDRYEAYNYKEADYCLAETNRTFDLDGEENHDYDNWSDYHQEYISEDDSCYVDIRNDYFYCNECVDAYVYSTYNSEYYYQTCFEDDCIKIDGDWYYAGVGGGDPSYYGIERCPQCNEYFIAGRGDSVYSELTEEDYCCGDCAEESEKQYHEDNGHVYSDYDEEWFEYEEDVITAVEWCGNCYYETSISIESFNSLVEDGRATEFCGDYYIDDVKMDGEPRHLLRRERIIAA